MSRAPETRRVCVISTAHLTAATVAVLSGPREGWPIYGGAYGPPSPDGFFVHVAEPGDDEIPADLAACCAWAKAFDPPFDYIMFDADADEGDDLPAYDHADAIAAADPVPEEPDEHAENGCQAAGGSGWPCQCEVNDKSRHG